MSRYRRRVSSQDGNRTQSPSLIRCEKRTYCASSDSQFQFGGGNTGAQVTGQWQTLPYLMTINPIRLGLLHNGQIVIVAGSENNPTEHAAGTSVEPCGTCKLRRSL
jgi:hypothetical protein